jgi:cell wall assembly regulator SMI1
MSDLQHLEHAAQMTLRSGASPAQLSWLVGELGVVLPPDYVAFLEYSDGAEGPIGDQSYLRLWSSAEVADARSAYRFHELTPHLVAFGTDGGGTAYAFDYREPVPPVVMVEFVTLDYDTVFLVAPTFDDFLVTRPLASRKPPRLR